MEIQKETDKTITTAALSMRQGQRYLKSQLLDVIGDFKNDNIIKLQFYTICYNEDLDEAKTKLEIVMGEKVAELAKMHKLAYKAIINGVKNL
tara:strand:- start:409 stop:684 length:276 start_codon:yes stop_codon:yes gene_type:complete